MTIYDYRKKLKSLIFFIAILLSATLICSLVVNSRKASAAYDGGNIIDNLVFLDANTMSKSDIQNFLVNKGAGLANMNFTLNCYAQDSKERQWYTSVGAPCDQSIPASHIIYYAAQIYGVNPRVILATMQKEQSLTTAPNPTAWQINQAMGYACPTSGQCGGNSTFPYQIDSGTWALRYHFERARGNNTWWYTSSSWTCGTQKSYYSPNLYPNQNVNFYDQNGTYYRTHYIANAATSAFYCYTPHAYNNPQGLYGREPYGTVGLYYSGSYNFVYFFELWFGTTKSNDTNIAHPNGTLVSDGWRVFLVDDNARRWIASPDIFNSYGFDWNRIKAASSGDNSLPWTLPLDRLAPGTLFYSDNTPLYVMDYEGGILKKRHVTLAAFNALGYQWGETMYVPPAAIPPETYSTPLSEAQHPSGTLIVSHSESKVYQIDNNKKRHVTSPLAFDTNFFKWDRIKNATASDLSLAIGSPIDIRQGTILNNNGLFLVEQDLSGNLKRPVGPWECYANRLNYTSYDWFSVSSSYLPSRTGSIFTC